MRNSVPYSWASTSLFHCTFKLHSWKKIVRLVENFVYKCNIQSSNCIAERKTHNPIWKIALNHCFNDFKKKIPNSKRNLPYPQEAVKKCNTSPNDQTLDWKNSNQQKCLGPIFYFIPLRRINPIWTHHFIPFENDSSKCRQEEEIKWFAEHPNLKLSDV